MKPILQPAQEPSTQGEQEPREFLSWRMEEQARHEQHPPPNSHQSQGGIHRDFDGHWRLNCLGLIRGRRPACDASSHESLREDEGQRRCYKLVQEQRRVDEHEGVT